MLFLGAKEYDVGTPCFIFLTAGKEGFIINIIGILTVSIQFSLVLPGHA